MDNGLDEVPFGTRNAGLFATDAPLRNAVFESFWMGGYEGADHISQSSGAVSMCDITQHQTLAADDYARLAEFDIRTVRESVGWRVVEQHGSYDFSSLETRARAAQELGLQVVWTLCHYGWPDDLDVFSPAFVERFARYAGAVAAYLQKFDTGVPVYAPINEISFLSWAACEGGRIRFDSRLQNSSAQLKRQLVRAAIAASDSIRDVNPRARVLHTDPLVHVVAPNAHPELELEALKQCEHQFQAWDMLSGRLEPELGGHPRHLDLVGVNYYCGNQWELLTGRTLNWRLDDPRRLSLAALLENVHARYSRPLVISETGHVGIERAAWLREVFDEVSHARQRGVPVQGVCLYPIIDRPDWDNTEQWHRSGLWDLEPSGNGELRRQLDERYAAALHEVQRGTDQYVRRAVHL